MKYLILILILFLFSSSFTPTKRVNTCLQMDLILLADFSKSIRGQEQFIVDAMSAFVNKFDLSENGLKIGIVVFNTYTYTISRLTTDKKDLLEKLKALSKNQGNYGTEMSKGFEACNLELFSETARPTYRKLIIIITDGDPDSEDVKDAYHVATKIKNMGVGICGVMVQDSSSRPTFLDSICLKNCYVEADYNSLVDELRKFDVCF